MNDEQIIKRKLVFDGEGTGDDRRINLLQKMIAKWVLSDCESQEENEKIYNKILLQLSLIQHSRQKSELIKIKNDRQLKQYKDYQLEIAHNIADIKEVINTSKVILTKVKCEKQQKLNYDMIVKDIVEQPPRIKTTMCVQQLQSNITSMEDSQKKFRDEFIFWRKHFVILLTSVNHISLRLSQLNAIEDTSVNINKEDLI